MTATNTRDAETLELTPSLTLSEVRQLQSDWSSYVALDQDVCIDLSNVSQIDSSGMQLLLCFVKAKQDQGKKVYWQGQSDQFQEVAEMLNMQELLGYES